MADSFGLSKMAKVFSPAYSIYKGVKNDEMPAMSPLRMMQGGGPKMSGMGGMAEMLMGKKKAKPTIAGDY